jgi:hypothetical protein
MCRDLCREADRIMESYDDPDDCPYPSSDELPEDVQPIGAQRFSGLHPADLLAHDRHHPVLRQRGVRGICLGAIPVSAQGVELFLAVSRATLMSCRTINMT